MPSFRLPAAGRKTLMGLTGVAITAALPLLGAGSAAAATATNACGSSYKPYAGYFLKSKAGAKGGVVHLYRASNGSLCATVERIGKAKGARGTTKVSLTPVGGSVRAKSAAARYYVGPVKAPVKRCVRVTASVAYAGATYSFDRTGWCRGTVTKSSNATEKAIAVAMAQLGKPYVWGAEGPNSFDCSGLTSYAFGKAGMKLPRVSREQYAAFPHTTTPRRGDLVFFGSPIHHVGIYLGDGLMVHAPRTGDVIKVSKVVAQLDAPKFARVS